MNASSAWRSFENGYRSLVSSRGGSSCKERAFVDNAGKYYLNFPEVFKLALGCSGRDLFEVVPEKDHRHVFFHVELDGESQPQATRLRDPGFVRSVVRQLHDGLRKQLQSDAAFRFFWSVETEDHERWVCTNHGTCWTAYNKGAPLTMDVCGRNRDQLRCPKCSNVVNLQRWCCACDLPRDARGVCKGTCGVRDKWERGASSSEGAELRRSLKMYINVRVSGVVVTPAEHENLRHGCAVHLNSCFNSWDFLLCIAQVEKATKAPVVGPVFRCADEGFVPATSRTIPRIYTKADYTLGLRLDRDAFRAYETTHFQLALRGSSATIRRGQFRKPTAEFEALVLSKLPLALRSSRVDTAWSEGATKPGFRCYFVREGSTCPCARDDCQGGGRMAMVAAGSVWSVGCLRCKRKIFVEGGSINANVLRDMLWQQQSRKVENDERVDPIDLVRHVGLGDFRDAFFTYRHDVHENYIPLFCKNIRKRRKGKLGNNASK